jgi:hypothetical protein
MLSPRDIYPPEWFIESSGKGKKEQPSAPNYERLWLPSGCVLLVMKIPVQQSVKKHPTMLLFSGAKNSAANSAKNRGNTEESFA